MSLTEANGYNKSFNLPACLICYFFFFNDTATTEIYTLSLHDALPTPAVGADRRGLDPGLCGAWSRFLSLPPSLDRKSTRLNSSHMSISYAVFFLKKKKHVVCANSDQHTKPKDSQP